MFRARFMTRVLALGMLAASLFAIAPASAAPAPAGTTCTANCLQVYSVTMYDYLQTEDVTAIVKVVDEAGGGVRSAVVHGVWTLPDGTTQDQYAITGTRLRAEFPLYTPQTGTFTFTVVDITKTGYTFDPAGSAVLVGTITIGSGGGGGGTGDSCTVNCLQVTKIKMAVKRGDVKATVTVVDENGASVDSATVAGIWTLPDGSTVDQTDATNSRGRAKLKVPAGASGTYTFTVTNVIHGADTYDATASITSNNTTVG